MSTSVLTLIAFCCWTAVLGIVIVSARGVFILGGTPGDGFPAHAPHGPPWYQRLCRVYQNCTENLATYAVVILVAATMDKTSLTDPFAPMFLIARFGQSGLHLWRVGPLVNVLRGTLYSVQMLIVLIMAIRLATA